MTAARAAFDDSPPALFEVLDTTFLIVVVLLFSTVVLVSFAPRYSKAQRARVQLLRRFGEEFVQEFIRPLTEFRGAGHAPRARYRIRAGRSRLEVLLAPSHGCAYPNLSDHRANVEYDVARVMAALGQESVVNGRPYAEGQWVVLPFQFSGPVKREGVR